MPKAVRLSLMKHLRFPHFECVYSIDLLDLWNHLKLVKAKISDCCSFENYSTQFIKTIAVSSSGPSPWPPAWPTPVVLGNLNRSFSPESLDLETLLVVSMRSSRLASSTLSMLSMAEQTGSRCLWRQLHMLRSPLVLSSLSSISGYPNFDP